MILHGRTLIIKSDGQAIAAAKSCTIDVQTDNIEITSPSTGRWKTYRAGRSSWKVDVSGLIVARTEAPVDDLVSKLSMTGSILSLECQVLPDTHMYPGLLPFDGWVSDITTEQTGLRHWPERIAFAGDDGKFVGLHDGKWYDTWYGGEGYMQPAEGAFFHDTEENTIYQWQNDYLEGYADLGFFSGQALCKSVRVAGSVGNLATYTASFLGSGVPNGIGSMSPSLPSQTPSQS